MNDVKLVDFVVTARKYKTQVTAKFEKRIAWKKPYEGDVMSSLPGTVLQIEVEKGSAVKAGDLLLLHEAMKMQNRIVAPIDGFVSELNVKVGDKIGKNHLMMKIEP